MAPRGTRMGMSRSHPLVWLAMAALAVLLGPSPIYGAQVAAAESATLSSCVLDGGPADLVRGQKEGRFDYKQGGLGTLSTFEYKFWVCIRPHPCALTDLDRFCFKYNAVLNKFDPWGRNTDLNLCTASGESAGLQAHCCDAASGALREIKQQVDEIDSLVRRDINSTMEMMETALFSKLLGELQSPGFMWRVGPFDNCNATCGSGVQWRQVWCASTSGGALAADELCHSNTKPPSTQACSSFTGCSYSFQTGSWGSCPATCGTATRRRTVECLRSPPGAAAPSPATSVVDSSMCASGSAAPWSTETCSVYSACTYTWSADPWRPCSTNCGSNGTRTRSVSCRRSDDALANTSVCLSSFGAAAKPAESESCSDTSGCPYAYVNECSAGTHTCSSAAQCIDTFGSFTCACKAGFQGSGKVCNDVNECIYSSSCPSESESSSCVNTHGSFRCECKKGFYVDSGSCSACPANTTTPSSGAAVAASSCSICAAGYYGAPSSALGCSPCPFASTSSDGATSESGCRCVPGYTLNATSGGSSPSKCVLDAEDSQQYLLYVSLPQLTCSAFCGSIGKTCKGGLLQNEYTEAEIAAASRNTKIAVEGLNRIFQPGSFQSNWWNSRAVCSSYGGEAVSIRDAKQDKFVNNLCLGQLCTIGLSQWHWNDGKQWFDGSGVGAWKSPTPSGSPGGWWDGSYMSTTYDGYWGIAQHWRQLPLCDRQLDYSIFPSNCSKAGSAGVRSSYETFAPYVSASSTCYTQASRIPGSDTCNEAPTLAGTHRLCACAAPCIENYYGTGTNCTRCPSSSVTAAGSTSMSQCSCLPGYYLAAAENLCKICPALSSSVLGTVGVAECKCVAGAYMNSTLGCQLCPANRPVSAAGSTGADSCVCSDGFYGSLGAAIDACDPCPHISTSKQGAADITGCFCPKGFGVARLGYSRQVALDTDVCEVELSSTPANTSGWHITSAGTSCRASCSARALACQDLQNWEMNTGPYMNFLVGAPMFDIACARIEDVSDNSVPPLSIMASSSRCFGSIPNAYATYPGGFCDVSKADYRRLCYCMCPANTYGPSTDKCQACPPNTVSPAGSRLASACVCSAGYYRADDASPCHPCRNATSSQFVGVTDTFSSNQDVRGWEGATATSRCGAYGHLLGGAGLLGDSSSLRKTFTNLCQHDKVIIRFSVVLVDGWEQETVALFVGGVPVANISAMHAVYSSNPTQCGFAQYGSFDDTTNGQRELQIEFTTPTIVHTERSLEVEIRTSLNAKGRRRHDHWVTGPNDAWVAPRFWGLQQFQVVMRCISTRSDCSVDGPQHFINIPVLGCGPNGSATKSDVAIGGAFARWHAKNWDGSSLPDSSPHGRHASLVAGSVSASYASGFGATAAQHYISGGTSDMIHMPTNSLPITFTLCSLSRYTGGTRGRIISAGPQGGSPNFLHGHHNDNRGVAYYDTWKADESSTGGKYDWLVMCGKNVQSETSILADGIPRSSGYRGAGSGGGQLNINAFNGGERSDWAVGHILMWDRHLSDEDMIAVSQTMMLSLQDEDIDLASCQVGLAAVLARSSQAL